MEIIKSQINNEYDSSNRMQEKVLDRAYKITRVISDGVTKYDTIYFDSIIEKILPVSSIQIQGFQYLFFSKYDLVKPLKYHLSFYHESDYLAKIDTGIVPNFDNTLIDIDSINYIDSPLELGDCCRSGCNRAILFDFKKAQSLDSSNYIYLITTVYEELSKHILVKDTDGELVKLFEIESSDKYLPFDIKNDSILYVDYWSYTDEDALAGKEFQYDLLNNEVLKDSVVN
ncbi:MAG: hypothetical protein U5K79_12085 [Cyclobacteriaceae bacterium]|nr:hypothetical protein [Cyclobacteriaceae bacterium]